MKTARIGNRHKLRSQVASLPNYFDCRHEALTLIEGYLNDSGLRLDDVLLNLQGDSGSVNIPILVDKETGIVCNDCDCAVELENVLVFAWYKMQSGRWEITTYVS